MVTQTSMYKSVLSMSSVSQEMLTQKVTSLAETICTTPSSNGPYPAQDMGQFGSQQNWNNDFYQQDQEKGGQWKRDMSHIEVGFRYCVAQPVRVAALLWFDSRPFYFQRGFSRIYWFQVTGRYNGNESQGAFRIQKIQKIYDILCDFIGVVWMSVKMSSK